MLALMLSRCPLHLVHHLDRRTRPAEALFFFHTLYFYYIMPLDFRSNSTIPCHFVQDTPFYPYKRRLSQFSGIAAHHLPKLTIENATAM